MSERLQQSWAEDDFLPLSALQHLVFCERQCALIHVEQAWRDDARTLEGSHMHDRTHEEAPRRELRGDLLIARGLHLRSLRLGVSGIADVVEFHRVSSLPHEVASRVSEGVILPDLRGRWQPYPVEYKRGKPKRDHCDEVQLCAQAICLEEMLGAEVPEGALFYGSTQHRHDVQLDAPLRAETERAATRLHQLFASGTTPRAEREPKCRSCSLVEVCRPDATGPHRSARRYLANAFRAASTTAEEP